MLRNGIALGLFALLLTACSTSEGPGVRPDQGGTPSKDLNKVERLPGNGNSGGQAKSGDAVIDLPDVGIAKRNDQSKPIPTGTGTTNPGTTGNNDNDNSGGTGSPGNTGSDNNTGSGNNGGSTPESTTTSGQAYSWAVASNGTVYVGSLSGGAVNNEAAYFCRATYNGSTFPGMMLTSKGGCIFSINSDAYLASTYELFILQTANVSDKLESLPAADGSVPANALGVANQAGVETFFCRTVLNGNTYIGKIARNWEGCYFLSVADNTVYYAISYEVLSHK